MATEERVPRSSLPPQQVLYGMATGHYVSRALDHAARLDIADLLRTTAALR